MSKVSRITGSRFGRLAMMGKLAGGIAGNIASQGVHASVICC